MKKIVVKVDLPEENKFIVDNAFIEANIDRKISSIKGLDYSFSDNFIFIRFEEKGSPISPKAFVKS